MLERLKDARQQQPALSKRDLRIIMYRERDALYQRLSQNVCFSLYSSTLFHEMYQGGCTGEITTYTYSFDEKMKWSTNTHSSGIVETQLVGKYNFYNFLA